MKKRSKAIFAALMLAACALSAGVGRVEYVTADLAKRTATVAWTWTGLSDEAVRLALTRNGGDFPTAGWGGTLFIGDGALGCAVAGTPNGYNELLFDVERGNVPTNGKYAVQIIATNGTGRVEEWARGTLTVRANPAAEGMPTNWSAYADIARKAAPYIDARAILGDAANADALWGVVSNRTDALVLAATNGLATVDGVRAMLPLAEVDRAERWGGAMRWADATGAVWQVTLVTNDTWTVTPEGSGYEVTWDAAKCDWRITYRGFYTWLGYPDATRFTIDGCLASRVTATTNAVDSVAFASDVSAALAAIPTPDVSGQIAAATNALATTIPRQDAIATNLVRTVISNSLYNLTYDAPLGVTWKKTAEGGAFFERCYTNVNMIGVRP